MKRILLLITDLQIGGTPTVVRELALRLKAAGDAYIEVACLSRWGPVADQISQAGIRVTALEARNSISLPIVVWRLVRLIRARQIDTVFSFLVHANTAAAAASAMSPGVRFLQSIQTTQPNPRWHWHVQAVAQKRAERIVVPSPSVARVAREWASVPAEKIVVIPNAVEVNDFGGTGGPPVNSGIQESTGGSPVPRKIQHIGFIGRLDPIKRIGDLLEAFRLLTSTTETTFDSGEARLAAPLAGRFLGVGREACEETKRPASGAAKRIDPADIHLHIFGAGPERANIERSIARLAIHDRVTLHGAVARPQEALAQLHLLVLPSDAEGFGLVIIEAMAAGIPVVATNVPGIRDVVRDGETGVLVPVRSPARLAKAISAVLGDPDHRAEMVARARDDVRARFSWESVLPQYQKLLGISR